MEDCRCTRLERQLDSAVKGALQTFDRSTGVGMQWISSAAHVVVNTAALLDTYRCLAGGSRRFPQLADPFLLTEAGRKAKDCPAPPPERNTRMRLRNLEMIGVLAVIALSSSCSTHARSAPIAGHASADDDADADVRDFRIGALTARVRLMPPGVERDYFLGILAGRSGRTEESLRLLKRALPEIRTTQPQRAAIALKAVAEAYVASYRYRQAAQAYDDLEKHLAEDLRRDVGNDAALARLLRDVSAQTVEWVGPVRLPTSRNPIGSLVSEITIAGLTEQWLLDTGANQSVVSRSYAQRLGLVPLPGVASVGSGLTGLSSPLQAAVIPQLPLGRATVRNVVVVILDDANLRIGGGPEAYQIHAVLGYPVLKGLGQVTFTRDGEFLAGQPGSATVSVPMFMR